MNELCAKETYQTNCFGTTPVGDFEIENQVNSETVVPAGSALTLTLKYNPFWNNSGKASDAIDIKYSTNAPEFVDGEVEVSATTVRPKLWVNDVPNGGGTILQTDFFDYDERTTAFNFGVQNIYDSSTREFHLRNHGGYTNGSFPNQSYNNWGNLEIKSIEIEGGDGVFTLMNEYKRCSAYKWNLTGESSDQYWLSINSGVCAQTFSLPRLVTYFNKSSTFYDVYTYRTKVVYQPTSVQSDNATLKLPIIAVNSKTKFMKSY